MGVTWRTARWGLAGEASSITSLEVIRIGVFKGAEICMTKLAV